MKLCVAGAAGAFGTKHLDALGAIDGVEVVSVVGAESDDLEGLAKERGIGHWTTDLAESLQRDEIDGVILATPTPVHARQAIQCMKAGKNVLVEIPMADTLADAQEIVRVQKETGVLAMAGQVQDAPRVAVQAFDDAVGAAVDAVVDLPAVLAQQPGDLEGLVLRAG